MDTSRFYDDVIRLPEKLSSLADAVEKGLPSLDSVPLASRVLIIAMGSSRFAAESVAREARAGGYPVTVELASATLLPPPSRDQLVIAISATGGSVEVLSAAQRYAGMGRLVAITNTSDSSLAQLADLVIPLLADVEVSGVACRTFRHTFIVLSEVLNQVGAQFAQKPPQVALAGAAAIDALLSSTSTWLEPISTALKGPSGSFVLAPAERFSSAQQSALMLREVPRRPAFASETGDWSHVDVYLTKTLDYRALLFAGSVWDDQALDWLAQRGSTVVSVGRDLEQAGFSLRYPGDEDRMTATLAETVVAELVAWDWYRADPEYSWSERVIL